MNASSDDPTGRAPNPRPAATAADDVDPMLLEERSTRNLWCGIQSRVEILARRLPREVVPPEDRSHVRYHHKRTFEELSKFSKAAAPGQQHLYPGLPRPLPGSMLDPSSFPLGKRASYTNSPLMPPTDTSFVRHDGALLYPGFTAVARAPYPTHQLPAVAGDPTQQRLVWNGIQAALESLKERQAAALERQAALESLKERMHAKVSASTAPPAIIKPELPPPADEGIKMEVVEAEPAPAPAKGIKTEVKAEPAPEGIKIKREDGQ